MSAIDKISMIEENKVLKDHVKYLETWKDNAKKTLKIYDDMGDQAPLTLLMDSLAEFLIQKSKLSIPGVSKETMIEFKIILAEGINEKAQELMREFFYKK